MHIMQHCSEHGDELLVSYPGQKAPGQSHQEEYLLFWRDSKSCLELIEERHTRNVPTSTESAKKPVIVRPTIGNPGYQVRPFR